MISERKSIISLLLILILLASCSPNKITVSTDQAAAEPEPKNIVTEIVPEVDILNGDGIVRGWAVLAEKDNYDDVQMTNLPVDYIGITQLHQLLLDSGWQEKNIHEAREFDRKSLISELDWLAENADQDDLVFVYVSGHSSYLRNVLHWNEFFGSEWEEIPSHYQILLVDACEAEEFTDSVMKDPESYLSIASVAGDEYAWSGLKEEGLPIIGGVFTHYFTMTFQDLEADIDGDGQVSVQEAAFKAEIQTRTYMHEVVFSVPQFVEDYHAIGVYPDKDPEFPHVIVTDTISEPMFLKLK